MTKLLDRTEFCISLVLILKLHQVNGFSILAKGGKPALTHPLSLSIGVKFFISSIAKDWLEFVLRGVKNIVIFKIPLASCITTEYDDLGGTYGS